MRISSTCLGFPTFPNLCGEVGNFYALILNVFPNPPNLPNLFPRARTRERVCEQAHTPARARLRACATSKKGWEGWEGWEEVAAERVLRSQPRKKVGKGWEAAWETRGNDVMEQRIAQMRADFERLAAHRCASGQWGEADASDAGRLIKAAIDAQDWATVVLWGDWLAASVRWLPATVPLVRSCLTCSGLFRPGVYHRPGYCGRRNDLAPAYGEGHPLRQLPADLGASCDVWGKA